MEIARKTKCALSWEQHISCWEVSKLSQKSYCKLHALSFQSFHHWRKQLNKKATVQPLTIVQLGESPHPPKIISPSKQMDSSPMRFWVGAYRIEVADGFNPESLGRLVQFLRTI